VVHRGEDFNEWVMLNAEKNLIEEFKKFLSNKSIDRLVLTDNLLEDIDAIISEKTDDKTIISSNVIRDNKKKK
jgi:hypothetical protein